MIGVAGLLLSAGYAVEAANTLPMGSLSEPGAALFPILVAVLMAISSLALVVEQARLTGSADASLPLPRGADLRRLLGIALSVIGYIWLLSYLGFLVASILMALALVRLLTAGSWVRTAVVALAISISTYVLFVVILGVPLPKGELG